MSDLISDLNQIYQTKIEIKEILGTDSDVLAYYPAYIRSMIGNSGVSYAYLNDKLSYYVETSDLESMGYATETYVTNAIAAIPSVDLSSYVTYTYLESCGYATQSYVADYVSEHGSSAVIDEDLIPKESYTYSLGSDSYMYKAAYLSEVDTNVIRYDGNILFTNQYNNITWGIGDNLVPNQNNTYNIGRDDYRVSSTYAYNTYTNAITFNSSVALTYVNYAQLTMKLNNTNMFMFHKDMLAPNNNNATNLGSSNLCWKNTYTNNLYLNGSDINTIFPTYAYVAEHGGGGSTVIDENIVPKETATYTLGDSTYQYAATYTNNLYLGSYNITDMINGMFSYDTTTGTLTITTL